MLVVDFCPGLDKLLMSSLGDPLKSRSTLKIKGSARVSQTNL